MHIFDVVLEVPRGFEDAIAAKKACGAGRIHRDPELVEEPRRLRDTRDFPEDPWEQLRGSIDAVFSSWNNQRAITYRKINGIRRLGTA